MVEKIYQLFLNSNRVVIDNRQVKEGDLFFSIKGERLNGNQFAKSALENGARFAIVDDINLYDEKDERYVLVEDCLLMLQLLARHHRDNLDVCLIAIAGSNGKTTTKELIHAVLSSQYKTFATPGNFNNHIGLPLSVLSINNEHDYAIIEMGANHLGEIKQLCDIANPDYGLITNIGKEHLEGFGSIENVKKANGELFDYLRAKSGTVFINATNQDLIEISNGISRITYGNDDGSSFGGRVKEVMPELSIEYKGKSIQTNLAGHYNFENVMAAIALGEYFNIELKKIVAAIERYEPQNNRSQVIKRGTNTIILDAYNANPSSMELALDNLALISTKNKMVILGDMLEMGDYSDREHLAIVNKIKQMNLSQIVLIGTEFGKLKDQLECRHFADSVEAAKWFDKSGIKDHYILIKGSRGGTLEKVLEG